MTKGKYRVIPAILRLPQLSSFGRRIRGERLAVLQDPVMVVVSTSFEISRIPGRRFQYLS